ncbi:helix-turn-helix domain-containing protein [Yinghuangia aomiensis]
MTQPAELDTAPPFDPEAARTARSVMAFTPERVAATLASYGVNAFPRDVRAWEDGSVAPTEDQLIGLAKTLAVPVGRLMGESGNASLHALRLRAGLTAAAAGKQVGMSEATWLRMERGNAWRADERRTQALIRMFSGLTHRQLVEVSGAREELSECLAKCLGQGRAPAYVSPVTEVLGLRRRKVAEAMEALIVDFPPPGGVDAKPKRTSGEQAVEEPPAPPLPAGAMDRFWDLMGNPPADPYAPGAWRRPPRR